MDVRTTFCSLAAAASLLTLGACQRSEGGSASVSPHSLPSEGTISRVPVGPLAGAGTSTLGPTITNPYGDNRQAIHEGRALYLKMNCAGCHAYSGKGNMGPDLTDKYWRYGGAPVNIYKSIYEGRPQGMPAWGKAMPPQDIWKLVAYIESLGGSFPAADYHHALQGDRSGEQVAPEVTASEQAAAGAQSGTQAAPGMQPGKPASGARR